MPIKNSLDPELLRTAALKRYLRSDLLRAELSGENIFPLEFPLPRLKPAQLLSDFGRVREWTKSLEQASRERIGFGYSIKYKEISHRQLGKQRVPHSAIFPTAQDYLSYLDRQHEYEKHKELIAITTKTSRKLVDLILAKPALFIENAKIWNQLLKVCDYFMQNLRPDLYLRSLNIEGTDTKFIETNKRIISTMLDRVLPEEAIDWDISATSRRGFEKRYGLSIESPRVRFRALCPDLKRKLLSLSDLEITAREFAILDVSCETVFIVENKTTGLEFPDVPASIVIFGLGKAVEILSDARWLNTRRVVYSGDIDTHGFHILSILRTAFPHVESILMDAETLLAHKNSWVQENYDERFVGKLDNLKGNEEEAYRGLLDQTWGTNVRLEQESIPIPTLVSAVKKITRT